MEFDNQQLIDISLGCAAGVRHLHSEGVIHRDLAARNVNYRIVVEVEFQIDFLYSFVKKKVKKNIFNKIDTISQDQQQSL